MDRTRPIPVSIIVFVFCLLAASAESAFADEVLTTPLLTFAKHSWYVNALAYSPDGTIVATGEWNPSGTINLWRADTGATIRTLTGDSGVINTLAFSPDGTRLVSTSSGQVAQVWNVATGECMQTLTCTDAVRCAVFSSDGAQVVTGDQGYYIKFWDVETGALQKTIFDGCIVLGVALSPDGRYLLAARNTWRLALWDLQTGTRTELAGHVDSVWAVSFSTDGRRAVSAGHDKTAKLWDMPAGTVIRSFDGHSDLVRDVRFSPDCRRIVTASFDGTAKVWDVETAACIYTIAGHTAEVNSAAFSPDGLRVAIASNDKTAKVWSLGIGLSVKSSPITDVQIDGSHPGTTNYRVALDGAAVVSLSAPAEATNGQDVYQFVMWNVDGTPMPAGQRDIQISVDSSLTATAFYDRPLIAVESAPLSGVTISGDKPGTTSCSAGCNRNDVVDLAAPPTAMSAGVRYNFVRWIVDEVEQPEGETALQVTMDVNHTVTAVYARQTWTLTVNSSPLAGVIISGGKPGTTSYTAACEDQQQVRLAAPATVAAEDGSH